MSARGTQDEAAEVLRESNTAANRGNMNAADTATKAADSSAPTPGAHKPKAVLVEVGATASSDGESLQDRFMRFRKQRAKAMRAKQERAAKERADPEFKDKLRQKFLDTAMKYIGVPYAQKYHEPGTELYNAPLFLDYCGLVRKTMDDLQEDFGFRIGRWNQAYMYDTLPKELAFEDLKPGDLIFYSGIYTRKNAKQQKHNMVHVEIFVGGETGEASLGARWQKGRCKIFDSFKFTSKNYHSIQYYYRSLDTWLEGVCKSFCDEHPWEVKGFQDVDSSKSVFFQQSADGGNCDSDGESDDGGDECKSGASDCAGASSDAPCNASDGVEAEAPAAPALNEPESNGASVANPTSSSAD